MISKFFKSNRARLINNTQGGVIVLSAYSAMQRSGDSGATFEQESNFWWLTGINKPDWWLIIDGGRSKSWLVFPEISDIHQTFNGGLSVDEAKDISGVDSVISNDEATRMLRDLASRHSVVGGLDEDPSAKYYDFVLNPAPKKMWRKLETIFNEVQDIRSELSKLRAIKQPEEIRAIKSAIKLTIASFSMVKEKLPNLKHEYEIEAEFSYYFRQHGAAGHAYDPIVASGRNACTLHYADNSSAVKSHSLVLMDIGARINGYAADISRTYAVGAPTKRQIEVHAAVESAHRQIIKLLRPGLSVAEYHNLVDEIMQSALKRLDLLNSPEDYRRYFPHAISHGLGVDVHDSLGKPTVFLPGMILTVEPGIYIPKESIGVRIEDNILITETGNTNLSAALPTSL